MSSSRGLFLGYRLSEIGVKALRTQIGKIIGIATVSDSRAEYEKYIAEKIYGQQSLDLN
ncbi:hypothetical protein ACN079_01975 [Pseudomonas sp. ABY48]|uniref:hypothetical protein n=1 Tax=Pseudomonas sp. ABY48 TaxID=3402865 RepID=UPI003B428707